jgi:SAM-dependent methyltransferase
MGEQELRCLLHGLYAQCIAANPADAYLAQHGTADYIGTKVRAFLWYSRYLPQRGRVLDWGCHHAPDSCLARAAFGGRYELHGCDFHDPRPFSAFHDCAGLTYTRLSDPVRLPYADGQFAAVIAAGALEHAARDIESLGELWRCVEPGGVLIVTDLPNRWSYKEWFNRLRRRPYHDRRYSLRYLGGLLSGAGFVCLESGHQTRSAVLSPVSGTAPARNALIRLLQLHRLASCLCSAARKPDGPGKDVGESA